MLARLADRLADPERAKRIAWAIVAAEAAYVVASILYATFPRTMLGGVWMPDFIAHYAGGRLASRPIDLYRLEAQQDLQTRALGGARFFTPFVGPPTLALFYSLFARLPLSVAMPSWILLSVAALGIAIGLVTRLDRARALATSFDESSIVLLLAFAPLAESIATGHDAAGFALIWAAGISLAVRRKDFASGLVFGLGVLAPHLFVVPIVYLVASRRVRAVAGVVVVAAAWVGLACVAFGARAFTEWLQLVHSTELESILEIDPTRRHSLWGLLLPLFPETAYWLSVALAAAASLGIVVVSTRRALAAATAEQSWALVLVTSLAVSPQLFLSDLVVLVVAVLALGPRALSAPYTRVGVGLYASTWISAFTSRLRVPGPWPDSVLGVSIVAPFLLAAWWRLYRDAETG
jgi:hypothetical protein